MGRTIRRTAAVASLGVAGLGVAALEWWAILFVIPGVGLAFLLDRD